VVGRQEIAVANKEVKVEMEVAIANNEVHMVEVAYNRADNKVEAATEIEIVCLNPDIEGEYPDVNKKI